MEPTTSSSWTSNFWSNGGSRKRKAAVTDLDEKINQKMFVTEDKMVKEMQTLSLELAALQGQQNVSPSPPPPTKEKPLIQEVDENQIEETHLEFHKLLQDSLKNDDLHDSLISKLCENERRKLTMQIVPYIPIHPAQLNEDNRTTTIDDNENSSDQSKSVNDDYVFKIPSIPTPYTVEEPCDSSTKRSPTMKRSYSQSDQYNSNLSVTELKPDGSEYSAIDHPQTAYFIVEPTATPLVETLSNSSSSSLSSNGRITDYLDVPSSNNEFTIPLDDDDDDIDMQSVSSSDTGDKMDDD